MGHHAPRRCCLSMVATIERDSAAEIFPPRIADPELVETGRRLFAGAARFVAGAAEPAALPPESLPEIAFAGRSNVGKSSLINALTGRRMLARTSDTPGRTRQINFFDLGGLLMLVDLPGYGYAAASKDAIKRWTGLIRRYLQHRATLRRVCLLVDSRHGLKVVDSPLLHLLDQAGVSYQIVLTKIDKLGPGDLAPAAEKIAAELAAHTAAYPEIHLTSADERRGIAALRATLGGFALVRPAALAMAASGRPG